MKTFEPNLSALGIARDVLLTPFGLDEAKLLKTLGTMFTHKVDYADLYFQFTKSEGWSLEEGIVKTGSFSIDQGFLVALRAHDREHHVFKHGAVLPRLRNRPANSACVRWSCVWVWCSARAARCCRC